jgi:hypothetical protein
MHNLFKKGVFMRSFVFFCFSVFCFSFLSLKGEENCSNLHVCTVATKQKQGLNQLLVSAQKQGIKIDVLGLGKPYSGNAQKLIFMQAYLKELPPDDVVLFVDGYDVLILANEKTIMDKFLTFNAPFVISAERNCYPYAHLASKYPESPTLFRYMNTGTYIGYVSAIQKIIENLLPIDPKKDDQALCTLDYFVHPEQYTFDYFCELFLPLCMIDADELVVNKDDMTVQCKGLKNSSCIIHGNGSSPLYQMLYDYLFLNKIDEYDWAKIN